MEGDFDRRLLLEVVGIELLPDVVWLELLSSGVGVRRFLGGWAAGADAADADDEGAWRFILCKTFHSRSYRWLGIPLASNMWWIQSISCRVSLTAVSWVLSWLRYLAISSSMSLL